MLDGILQPLVANATSSVVILSLTLLLAYLCHAFFLHPLSHIPGPLHRRLSSIPLLASNFRGTESSVAASLHAKYGPIVLLGPNDVHINDGGAIAPIYIEKGGFRKAPYYHSTDIDGMQTIFSTTDPEYRAVRAKAVMALFATSKIQRDSAGTLRECADDFVGALKMAKNGANGGEVDLIDLARRYSLDAMSGYLFGKRYGAFTDYTGNETLSAAPYVDFIQAFTRFFLLPTWILGYLLAFLGSVYPNPEFETSIERITAYVRSLVNEAKHGGGKDTFQKRLLDAGISETETIVQCEDAIFAGTDAPGTTLGLLVWNLVKHPEYIRELGAELTDGPVGSMSLLRATIQEGNRTSLANPVRLPRIVPPQGWTYTPSAGAARGKKSFHLPAGTAVGTSAYSLHLNETTFPSPHEFNPRRWVENGQSIATREMNRDLFAFGAGSRQCIAQNLAMEEMFTVIRRLVESDVLSGARVVCEEVRLGEWFNAKLRDGCNLKIRWTT